MTVFVDDMRMQATVPNGNRKVSGRWSHLMADSEAELMFFAVEKLGMRPSWIQHPGTPDVHFDVVDSRRLAALKLGAVSLPCGSPEWMAFFEAQHAKFVRRCANCGGPLRYLGPDLGSEHWYPAAECASPKPGFEDNKRAWMPKPEEQFNEWWDVRSGLTGRLMSENSWPSRELAQQQIDAWMKRAVNGGRPDIPIALIAGMIPVQRFGVRPESDSIGSTREELIAEAKAHPPEDLCGIEGCVLLPHSTHTKHTWEG